MKHRKRLLARFSLSLFLSLVSRNSSSNFPPGRIYIYPRACITSGLSPRGDGEKERRSNPFKSSQDHSSNFMLVLVARLFYECAGPRALTGECYSRCISMDTAYYIRIWGEIISFTRIIKLNSNKFLAITDFNCINRYNDEKVI